MVLKDLTTGHLLFHNRKGSSLTVERLTGARLRVRGSGVSASAFLLTASRGFLSINGRRFRDQIRIYPANAGSLWVINALPIEDYLAGLINWEISSQWPMEAVKAQVVAARTYARFQKTTRQGELFDVEATTADQVYGGMEREDGLSRKAVSETAGEMILFRKPDLRRLSLLLRRKDRVPRTSLAREFSLFENPGMPELSRLSLLCLELPGRRRPDAVRDEFGGFAGLPDRRTPSRAKK